MKKSLFLGLMVSLILTGCSQTETLNSSDNTSSQALSQTDSPLKVVTSFYPLAFMTQGVLGDDVEVVNLAGATDVHEYRPSPQDLVKLNQASLVVYQGAELEPWAEDVISELEENGVATLEVSAGLELIKMEEHEDHHNEEDHDEHEDEHHDDEHEDDHHDDEDHDDHHHGEFDPHTWLDPVLAQSMIETITAEVVRLDPANAEVYQANANDLKSRFAALDQSYRETLSACANSEVIVSHDAYGYLASRYGFELHAIAGLSTQDEPSAKILAELKEEAEEGITHILIEENNIQRFAQTLANETGLETLPINPLGKGTIDPNKDFIQVMDENLQSLKTALACE